MFLYSVDRSLFMLRRSFCITPFLLRFLLCAWAKKDLNFLDSPGLTCVWCGNSDRHNNTNYFTSLSNQGVFSTPSLVSSMLLYECVCTYICVCICTCVCTFVHVLYMCVHTCVYVCVHMCCQC